MLRSNRVRLFIVLIVCITLTVASVQAQNIGRIGISNGQVAAMAVGAGAVIGLVVYLAIPKQKTIEGCVAAAGNSLKLTDVKDNKTYVLESGTFQIKPGQHVKVKGKKSKGKSGTLRLRVKKIVKEFGPCTQALIAS